MLIRESQVNNELFEGSDVDDYPIGDEVGVSRQYIEKGNSPSSGWFLNKECREVCYVKKGCGDLEIENKRYVLLKGDVYVINPGQKSRIFDANKLELVVFTTPNWTEEQCEIIPEDE